jgi:predicted nucleic acid-binding Zn ribbon protein
MPVYTYGCKKCDREVDVYNTIANIHRKAPKCCKARMYVVIKAAFVRDDIPGYVSPATGKYISTKSARRDDLKRSNSRPWEGYEQEMKEAARKRKYTEQKQDAKLEEATRYAWHQLPPSKRKELDGSE